MEEVNKLFDNVVIESEQAKDVEILYSDSAQLRVKILSPVLIRHTDKTNPYDEFPAGLRAEFFNENKKVISWLVARYAVRYEKSEKIITRDSVVLFNKKNEKLETSELIWDEKERKIYTDKFIRITQPEKGDTSYGYGFITDQEFNRFEIKRKFTGKTNVGDIKKSLGLEDDKPEKKDKMKYLYEPQ
jgi:hypothetical protein